MPFKIISGGQTGVDRAALDVAILFNLPHGGWCPKNRGAEDGTIPTCYSLQETDTDDVNERTKKNIEDSDGTVVILPQYPIPSNIQDGTLLTLTWIKEKKKPFFLVDLSKPPSPDSFTQWLFENNVADINFAGPRQSSSPGIYEKTKKFLEVLFPLLFTHKNLSCANNH